MKRKLLLAAAILLLAGCANLKFQMSASYMNDNMAAEMAERERAEP